MKRLIVAGILSFFIFSSVYSGSVSPLPVYADELDDITKELEKLQSDLDASRNATKPLEEDLDRMRKQLASIKATLNDIELSILAKEKEITRSEKALVKQKEIIDERIHAHYKNLRRTGNSLIDLLGSSSFTTSVQNLFYQKKAADNDKQTILRIVLYIKNIDDAKEKLADEKVRLAAVKKRVDEDSAFLSGEVDKAKTYQAELSSKIASLSARQQQLIAQKLGSLNLPTSLGFGSLACVDDRKKNPGFSPAFAFYTFGIPHRVGMNQYGALGRAQAGQNVEQILDAYFDNVELKKDYSQDIQIPVQGHGTFNIEDYTKRIYEMPESWPLEALKAQAILARTYALNYTNNGSKEICTTQSCQVFKPDPKTGAWNQAVEETKGWVLVQGGSPITAWYSSTDGGYTFRSEDVGWSGRSWTKRLQDGTGSYNSWDDLFNKAYDKDSPCFYAAQGWRSQYDNSAWLKSGEVADIANVILLAQKDSSTQEKLYQTDKAHPYGGEIWNEGRVRDELRNRGITPFSSVSDVSVSADFGSGQTTGVTISGDAGSKSFNGKEWKDWFNLRAPANMQIVGGLFRAERK